MRQLAKFGLLATIAALGAACSSKPTLHLVGNEPASPAEITINGKTGVAKWTWGNQHFSQTLEVTEDNVISAVAKGGSIKLKLGDGSLIELAGEYNVFVCASGCDSLHMPIAWKTVTD